MTDSILGSAVPKVGNHLSIPMGIGWLGEVARGLKLGATYANKTYMTKLDEYSGLFADGGSFHIPANAGFGIAIEPVEKLTIAADVQRIFYGDVDSIANPGPTAAEIGASSAPTGVWVRATVSASVGRTPGTSSSE